MSQRMTVHEQPSLEHPNLHPFTDRQLRSMCTDLQERIQIGVNRTGEPTTTDGGVLALPTGIEPISMEQVAQIPNGSPVITAACGGTNWMFAVAVKQSDGSLELSEAIIRPIPENERQHTFASLVDLIADEILAVGQAYDLLQQLHLPIAISFGFPQHNVRTEQGDIDARLTTKQLPKFWQITDLDESRSIDDQVSLTDLLRIALLKRGFVSIGSIVFINDTVAVALDVQHGHGEDLPVGFVFGTGTNAAMYAGPEKGIVNLEIGHASIVPRDPVLEMMEQRQWVPNTNSAMEYWMGGGSLPARLAASLLCTSKALLDAEQVATSIMQSTNQAIVSDIAMGVSPARLQFHVAPDDHEFLQHAASKVLQQAGQLIGLHIAAVSQVVGYQGGVAHVPYEGSLLAKGHSVAAVAQQTVQFLLPGSDIRPYKASGILGIAKLALLKTQARFGE